MKYLMLFLLLVLPTAANAQTVNGSLDAAFAIGKWKESHEGVSLFCVRVTTQEDVLKGVRGRELARTRISMSRSCIPWPSVAAPDGVARGFVASHHLPCNTCCPAGGE